MKVLRPLILITIILSICFGNNEFNGGYPKRASFGIITAEFGGSLVGGFLGVSIFGLSGIGLELLFGTFDPNEFFSMPAFILGAIGGTFGCATGAYLVGSAYHQGGKFLPTLTGSALGLVVLSPVGSVIGYNLSRPKTHEYGYGFFYKHFDPPTFSFRAEKTKENKITPVYDLRLVNARF